MFPEGLRRSFLSTARSTTVYHYMSAELIRNSSCLGCGLMIVGTGTTSLILFCMGIAGLEPATRSRISPCSLAI